MAKLTGAKKKAFLERMAKGRRKATRNPKRKAAKKRAPKKAAKKRAPKKAAKKNPKRPSVRKSKKAISKASRPMAAEWAKAKHKAAAKKRAKRKPARGRRNPDTLTAAEEKFLEFHGKEAERIVEYQQMYRYPSNFAEMGKLLCLKIDLDDANPDFKFSGFGATQAVCTPDGSNIYFIGGDQEIDLDALDIISDKDFVELGPCNYIEYFTVKGFHNFAPTKYFHEFGEEDGIQPTLVYDRLNKTLFLTSGNYRVRPEGIVN